MQIVIDNYFKLECDVNTSIRNAYEKGFRTGVKKGLAVRPKLDQSMWIPCSERLPEEAGEYICTLVGVHDSGIPSECGFEPSNQKGIIPGWSTCEADGFKFLRNDEVIAWMPMPEPYQEGKE